MIDQYAVVGNPVAHSKSPIIHLAFAEQTAQAIHYSRVLAPLDGFSAKIDELRQLGFKGLNVTVPFKLEAFKLSSQLTSRAHYAGAVNTLIFRDSGIMGDNTDGAGLVRDIEQNNQIPIQGKRILLIGAGGAAEGVLQPILACHPASVTIVNRTLNKATQMAKKVADKNVTVATFDELSEKVFDIVINATSTGLSNDPLPLSPSVFLPSTLAYDMMYGKETPFMALARGQGAQVADGLGMLVEQAAEAFFIWRGVRPETNTVMQALRAS